MPKPPTKRPGNDLSNRSGSAPVILPQKRPLAIFDQALPMKVVEALAFGHQLSVCEVAMKKSSIGVGPASVSIAKRIRGEHIGLLASVDRTSRVLERVLSARLDRETAIEMIGTMLGGFRAKGNREVQAAMLDLFEGDDIARALQSYYIAKASEPDFNSDEDEEPVWLPINATPASLALACRTLIATSPKYVPHPAELGNAVRKAQRQLREAQLNCQTVVEIVQISDAVMLEFAPREEWFDAWKSPHRRPALSRMLRLHEEYGDARKQYPGDATRKGLLADDYDDDGDQQLTAFGTLVKREQANFQALLGPVEFKRISEQIVAEDKEAPPTRALAQPKRIAAARNRSEAKRSASETEP